MVMIHIGLQWGFEGRLMVVGVTREAIKGLKGINENKVFNKDIRCT
jgi:hypothetical protein